MNGQHKMPKARLCKTGECANYKNYQNYKNVFCAWNSGKQIFKSSNFLALPNCWHFLLPVHYFARTYIIDKTLEAFEDPISSKYLQLYKMIHNLLQSHSLL